MSAPGRLLLLTPRGSKQDDSVGLLPPWLALLAAMLALTWMRADAGTVAAVLSSPGLQSAGWPALAAVLLAYTAWRCGWRGPAIPPGDVLVWLERAAAALCRIPMPSPFRSKSALTTVPVILSRIGRLEEALRAWPLAGGLWLLALVALASALLAV